MWHSTARGPGATEAWECLERLQRDAPPGSSVIRLVGNHGKVLSVTAASFVLISDCFGSELWWLEGHYHDRNKATDTRRRCQTITKKLREGIQDENIVASHVVTVGEVPVVFVHAGFRRDMITFLKNKHSIEGSAEELSAVTNKALRDVIVRQAQVPARTRVALMLLMCHR